MYYAGVDIGSTMTKVVILDDSLGIRSCVIGRSGPEHRKLAHRVMEEALGQADLNFEEISFVIATGYGRINVPFADRQITELTCHARGISHFFPEARTGIDIGGQDSKGLKIDRGRLVDFVMNDKCAAGTGRYLDMVADSLGLKVSDLGAMSLKAGKKIKISNTCTIFAQQEIVSLIAEGALFNDILAGLNEAIAARVLGMFGRLRAEPAVVFTGGVAKNIGVARAISEKLGYEVLVPENPLITGALGAAVLAKEIMSKAMRDGKEISKEKRLLREARFFED